MMGKKDQLIFGVFSLILLKNYWQ